MVFHPTQKDISGLIPTLEINGIEIERVSEFQNLGVIIDENLSWKSHTNILSNTMSKYTGILNKLKLSTIVCHEITVLQHGGISLKLRTINLGVYM